MGPEDDTHVNAGTGRGVKASATASTATGLMICNQNGTMGGTLKR